MAYGLAGAVAWTLVGLVTNALPLDRVALVLLVAYAGYYGAIEAAGRRGLPPPGRRWQVPQMFVNNRSRFRRVFTWAAILGPGFVTRNPYAGFGLLPLAVALPNDVAVGAGLAATVGALHGIGRGLALVRDACHIDDADYAETILRSMRWRTVDGLALLAIGGLGLMAIVYGASP